MAAFIDNYSCEELNNIVKNCFSLKEVSIKLGYGYNCSSATIKQIKKRLDYYSIDYSHFCHKFNSKKDISDIFSKDSSVSQHTLRRNYLKGNYSLYKCAICGQEPFWNGKKLTLILDHIDGNNRNNEISNLRWVCPNCNIQLDTTGFKKMRADRKLKKKYYCIDCGKEISGEKVTRCPICTQINNRKTERPTRDILKEEIRDNSFLSLSKKYNVSDNAIRKWCKYYNLPYKKTDIKNISDWENI